MKKFLFFAATAALLTISACTKTPNSQQVGEKILSVEHLEIDSLIINADSTHMRGNFVIMDSCLVFVDRSLCKIFAYSLENGELINTYSQRGQGPGDMVGILYGSVIEPDATKMLLINSSAYVYEFDKSSGEVKPAGRMEIHQNVSEKDLYDSPSSYFLLEMDNFGVTMTAIDDSTVIVPLSLNNRSLSEINPARYEKGHILGLLDTRTMKITDVKGKLPEWYKDNPMPAFEFFDYAIDPEEGIIYVNHAPDSLIYRYDKDFKLINTFGFEPQGIDRGYTRGFDKYYENFREDIKHVGSNTGLYYDPIDKILFRTALADFASGRVVLQAYSGNDLIMEQEMPAYFKVLGRYDDRYYGVRFMPAEDDDSLYFSLYSFKL